MPCGLFTDIFQCYFTANRPILVASKHTMTDVVKWATSKLLQIQPSTKRVHFYDELNRPESYQTLSKKDSHMDL